MTQLTPSQLTAVRNPNQSTQLYLAKYEPNIVFEAQIMTGTAAKGLKTITFSNVITGSYTNIVPGQSLYIGSSPDAWDIGRVRVRSATSGSITVAVDYEIQYADLQYLTVRDFHELWPVFPQAVLNTGTLQVTYYKDWDIAYSDQNVNFDPIIVMGTDYAGFWDTVQTNGIYFTATGSYTIDGSTISSYSWTFPAGCNPSSSTAGTPGTVFFPGPGMYVVSLTVNASNGKSSTGYRHIMVLNRHYGTVEGAPIDVPAYKKGQVALPYENISDWEFGDITEDHINGAISKITVRNRSNEFRDGDLVIIFAEDFYNNNIVSYGGYPGRESIVFMGYVDQGETVWDFQSSKTDFVLKGAAAYLANKEMFNVTVRDTQGTPADWTYIKNLTINKALIHYVRWHSTILQVDDFHCVTTGEGAYKEDLIVFPKAEILTNLSNFCQQKLLGFCSTNRHGDFYTEIDLQILLTGTRPASVMSFIESDWLGTPKVTEIIEEPLSNVLMGGVAYDPSILAFITGVPLLSRAPGYWQTYVGKSQNVSGLTLTSQSQLNNICGLYFYKINNETPAFQIDLANNMRNIDIYPQEFYNYSISGTATYRGLTWVGKRIIPRKITYKLQDFVLKQNISFEPETFGPPGDTVIIPTTLPKGNCGNCNPPPPCDCVVNPSCGGCPPPIGTGDGNTVYVFANDKVGRTRNFLSPSPTWADVTNTTSGVGGTAFILDPWNPINYAYRVYGNIVEKTTNLNDPLPTWVSVLTAATVQTATGLASVSLKRISGSILVNKMIFVAWSSNTFTGVSKSTDGGNTWVHHTFGNGNGPSAIYRVQGDYWNSNIVWVLGNNRNSGVDYPQLFKSTDGGNTWTAILGPAFQGVLDFDVSYPDGGKTVIARVGPNSIYTSKDGGASFPYIFTLPNTSSVTSSLCMNIATAVANDVLWAEGPIPYHSTDGGINWTQLPTIPGSSCNNISVIAMGRWPYNLNQVYWLWCPGGVSPAPGIAYSPDFFTTLQDKTGNWNAVLGTFANPVMIVPLWLGY